MHIDSTFWKTELFPAADRLEELSQFARFSRKRADEFERQTMFGLFSVRVLIERHKISEEVLTKPISVDAHPKRVSKPVTWLNSHRVEELYDLSTKRTRSLTPLFLCNQVIHSYILIPVQDKNHFSHILVCSDYERNRFLYFVPVASILDLLRTVASDYPSRMEFHFNPKKQDYDIRQYKI